MTKPLISILITAYNREKFIADAIESVLASTCPLFELIVVDDCSTDKTLAIAESYAAKDRRIRVYQNDQNLGDYPNRNRAASYATAEYLKFVDSDDRIYPETLRIMIDMLEHFPLAGFGLSDISANAYETYPVLLEASAAYRFHYFKRPIFFASPGLAIFRREAFYAVGGFPEKRMVGDFEMWHKLSLTCPVVLMPANLYWIRKHAGQEVAEQNKYVLEYEKIKIRYLFSDQSPLAESEALTVIQMRKKTVLKILLRKLAAWQLSEAFLRLKVYVFYKRSFNQLKTQAEITV